MTRKLKTVIITFLVIVFSVVTGLILRGINLNPGAVAENDKELIRKTIEAARQIQLEAEYTFDTSQFSTVYVNDPRGGEITDEALQQIREIRQDLSIQKDQVGILDSEIVVIERMKHNYDSYIEELRAKEAAGNLTSEESLILFGETHGWPTPTLESINPADRATQTCGLFKTQASSNRETATAMPSPTNYAGYSTSYPEPPTPIPATATLQFATPYPPPGDKTNPSEAFPCPTYTPTPIPVDVPYRGINPALLSPDELNVEILSIDVNGDLATAVVKIRSITTQCTLVKIDGHWFIAGSKLVKVEF